MPAEQLFGSKEAMDAMTFVVEMTKACAWPTVTLIALMRYRGTLADLISSVSSGINRVNRLKFGDVELTAEALQPVVESAEIRAETAAEKLESPDPIDDVEKAKLVEELQAANREIALLKMAQAKLSNEHSTSSYASGVAVGRVTTRSVFLALARAIGTDKVRDSSDIALASIHIPAVLQFTDLPKGAFGRLIWGGYISEGTLTASGIGQLRAAADEIDRRSVP